MKVMKKVAGAVLLALWLTGNAGATLVFGNSFPSLSSNLLKVVMSPTEERAYSVDGHDLGFVLRGVVISASVELSKDQFGSGGTLTVGFDGDGNGILSGLELYSTRLQELVWPGGGSVLRGDVVNSGLFAAVDGEEFYGAFPGGRPTNSSSSYIVENDDPNDFLLTWKGNLFFGEGDGGFLFTLDSGGMEVKPVPVDDNVDTGGGHVPEPGTLLLAGVALLAVIRARRAKA